MSEKGDYYDSVRLVYHPAYMTDYNTASCESPDRVRSIFSHVTGKYKVIKPKPCTDEDILMCHSEGLLIMEKSDEQRYEVARLSAGGAMQCADLAMDGYVSFGIIRPPGHHAGPDHNWGFCFFNNMAIAVKHLLRDGRIESATILDIDLHFGDGTDTIFNSYRNVHVLNISASNPRDFITETREALAKVKESGIIGISAGFDQYELDWGGNLSTEDYRTLGTMAAEFAAEKCGGKIFALLEGGYYVPDLGVNMQALLEGMCSGRT